MSEVLSAFIQEHTKPGLRTRSGVIS